MIFAPVKLPIFGVCFDAKSLEKDGLVSAGAACHSPSRSDKLLPFRNLVSTGALPVFYSDETGGVFCPTFALLKGTYRYESLRY
jgi:hypothetical protein